MAVYLTEFETLKQRKKMRIAYQNRFLLVAYSDDKIYCINDKCPHMGSTLSNGIMEGSVITCKDHGLPISLATGEVTDQSKAEFLKIDEFSRSVKAYKTFVKDGKVYLDL